MSKSIAITDTTYICAYNVDDIIITAKTSRETQEVKTALKNLFKL